MIKTTKIITCDICKKETEFDYANHNFYTGLNEMYSYGRNIYAKIKLEISNNEKTNLCHECIISMLEKAIESVKKSVMKEYK